MSLYTQRAFRALAMLNRRLIWVVLVLSTITSGLMALEPMIWRVFVNTITSKEPMLQLTIVQSVLALAGIMMFLSVMKNFLTPKMKLSTCRLQQSFDATMNAACSKALFHGSLDYHDQTSVGRTAEKLNRGFSELAKAVGNVADNIVPNLLYVGFTVAFMVPMNGALTAIVCFCALVPAVLGAYTSGKQARREEVLTSHRQSLFGRFYEGLGLIRIIRSFSRANSEHERYVTACEKMYDLILGQVRLENLVENAKNWSVTLGQVAIVGYGGWLVSQDKMKIGDLSAFYVYCVAFAQPVHNIVTMMASLKRSRVYLNSLFDIIDFPNGVMEMLNARQLEQLQGVLRFESITVRRGQEVALDNVSFTAQPGQLLAIVGAFGSGKSTLIGCAVRFLDPDYGAVSLDGVNLPELRLNWLRGRAVGLVQGTELWNDTVLANIAFGRPDASFDEIVAAAKAAGAHDFVMQKAEGYQYSVGKGGNRLSDGQRQLIALARLLLADPQVIILDEVTSHLDALTEDLVRQGIDNLVKRGKTVIVIAHRLSSIRNANRILVMDEGRVVEEGTHKELMRNDGLYAAFVAKQALLD